MIAGLNYSDIKDIANGNVEQNHFTKNLDKNELLVELADLYIKKNNEDFTDELDDHCEKLYEHIEELDKLADKLESEEIAEISENLNILHTKLTELKVIMEEINKMYRSIKAEVDADKCALELIKKYYI